MSRERKKSQKNVENRVRSVVSLRQGVSIGGRSNFSLSFNGGLVTPKKCGS